MLGELPEPKKEGGAGGGNGGAGGGNGGAGGGNGSSTSGTTSVTTSSATTSGSGGGACCDCDGDLHAAEGACLGDDCDDHDELVYPGESIYYKDESSTVGFDWDCSGTPERDPDLAEAIQCGLIGLPCAAGTAFLGATPPACGRTGKWGTCKQQGISCVEEVIEQDKPMRCK